MKRNNYRYLWIILLNFRNPCDLPEMKSGSLWNFVSMNNNIPQCCDDMDLLGKLSQNDGAAFTALYQKYWPVLTHLASGYVEDKDTCKEIVQELFVTLYRKRSVIKINISLSSYLYVSLRNRIRNHIRHQSVYNRHIGIVKKSHPVAAANNVEQFISLSELEREITSCLNQMPAKYKEVYLLYQQQQCTLKGIAAILNRPVDTVEKQLRKAVLLLRQYLTDHELCL
jgi:RNA polymerase sigma-70 factor (family 1)